jgi:hypothetical protein
VKPVAESAETPVVAAAVQAPYPVENVNPTAGAVLKRRSADKPSKYDENSRPRWQHLPLHQGAMLPLLSPSLSLKSA